MFSPDTFTVAFWLYLKINALGQQRLRELLGIKCVQ